MLRDSVQLSLPDWINDEIETTRGYTDAVARMTLAVRLAQRNIELETGGPFGAAIFTRAGELISVGVNRVVAQNCSVAHAEMMAFMCAQARLQRFRLNAGDDCGFILTTSAQPCCQCYGAAVWAGIDALEIGARAEDVTELTEFDEGPLPADWIGALEKRSISVKCDILRDAAREVLSGYHNSGGAHY